MQQLALILAKRIIELDPQAVPRMLWEAAKLFRQAESAEERQQLLDFQTALSRMAGRPLTEIDGEQQAAVHSETEAP